MRNILFALLSFIIIAGLVACDGEEVQDKDVSSVESSNEENEAAAAEEETEEEEEAVKEFNKEIIDNDSVKATLVSVEHIVDKDWDEEKYDIKFEVENKLDDTVEVQATEVSADGKIDRKSVV